MRNTYNPADYGTTVVRFAPAIMAPLVKVLGGKVTPYVTTHSSYQDGVQQEQWIRQRYGYAEPLLPPHWR